VMWTAEIWSRVCWEGQLVTWTGEIWSGVCLERQLGDVDGRIMERCLLGETAGC
jgi:hypothetical protein